MLFAPIKAIRETISRWTAATWTGEPEGGRGRRDTAGDTVRTGARAREGSGERTRREGAGGARGAKGTRRRMARRDGPRNAHR